MRITSFHKFNYTQNQLRNLDNAMLQKMEQVSTGRIFNRPSDNPIKMNESMLVNRTTSQIEQYKANLSDARSLLEHIDVTFESSVEAIHLAKELALRGANETLSAEDRNVIADSIEESIKQLLSFANTKHLGRYTFSGQMTNVVPLDYDGTNFIYNGNDNNMTIEISSKMKVDVSQNAEKLFVPVLEDLVELRDALRANDTDAIETSIGKLDQSFNDFVDNRSKMGVQLKSVEMMELAYEQTLTDLELKRTNAEAINLAEAYSEYKHLEHQFTAAIQSSMAMMRVSILNFM